MLFRLDTVALWFLVFAIVLGATGLGVLAGRALRHRAEHLREPVGAVQAALLGLVALLLAFGLSLAVGRYEGRRAAVVTEANALGTTYLRAQTLFEPQRGRSLALLPAYADRTIALTHEVPGSERFVRTLAEAQALERRLWTQAAAALARSPRDSAPRLYVETLNETIDALDARAAALQNRVPGAVLAIELGGSAAALFVFALFLSFVGRGTPIVVLAAVLVSFLLLVTFDLDRPARGLIEVPAGPLISTRASMSLPPAAPAPTPP